MDRKFEMGLPEAYAFYFSLFHSECRIFNKKGLKANVKTI